MSACPPHPQSEARYQNIVTFPSPAPLPTADLIYKYRVNLMLVGHQHSYERSCAVFNKTCVPSGQAPVHIVVGSAGAGLETGGFSPLVG